MRVRFTEKRILRAVARYSAFSSDELEICDWIAPPKKVGADRLFEVSVGVHVKQGVRTNRLLNRGRRLWDVSAHLGNVVPAPCVGQVERGKVEVVLTEEGFLIESIEV